MQNGTAVQRRPPNRIPNMARDSNQLFKADVAVNDGAIECLGINFPNDGARRAYFLEKLGEKKKDRDFRKIDGFPVGEDEDILFLSAPPYFTACPNPFVTTF